MPAFFGTSFVKLLVASLLLFVSVPVSATVIAPANLKEVASNRVWHALLHYERSPLTQRMQSEINSPEFFLSSIGKTDPVAELVATLAALQAPSADPNQSAQCRFPARYLWLSNHLEVVRSYPVQRCDKFLEWSNPGSIRSISMVFATGHLKSPASYFGHNFLKFNGAGATSSGALLEQTINYGAQVPDDEVALRYFYNGIFGGYSGVFERQPFYRHLSKYGEEDLRDVWEYKLNLSPEELQIIIAHTWELQSVELTYYFFRENCAYQIARLMALVSPAQLVPKNLPWTMPYNVFDKLMSMKIRGQSVVGDISYHPSRRSQFHQRYFSLSDAERSTFTDQVARGVSLDETDFYSHSASSQLALIDALLDYYEFRLRLNDGGDVAEAQKKELLLRRFQYPAGYTDSVEFQAPFPPHLAQKPGYLNFARTGSSSIGDYSEFSFRPAYFDFLSLDIGRSTSGDFTLLNTTIRIDEDGAYLRRLDLLNITNLAPSITGIQGDSGRSWHFRFGWDRPNNACARCRRVMADAMIGSATLLTRQLTGFALAGIRVQDSFMRDNSLAVRLSAGIVGQLGSLARIHASVERHEDTGSVGLDRNRLRLQLRLGRSSSWDLRLGYEKDVAEEVTFSAGYYW
jgi:hypothetical protein